MNVFARLALGEDVRGLGHAQVLGDAGDGDSQGGKWLAQWPSESGYDRISHALENGGSLGALQDMANHSAPRTWASKRKTSS